MCAGPWTYGSARRARPCGARPEAGTSAGRPATPAGSRATTSGRPSTTRAPGRWPHSCAPSTRPRCAAEAWPGTSAPTDGTGGFVANIAVASLGSRGDLFPLLGIGRSLRDRGHRVTVFEYSEYADDVTRTNLRFAPLGTGSACQEVFENSGETSQALSQLIRRVALPTAAEAARRIVAEGPFDVVIANHFQYGGQLAAELLGVPLISVTGVDIVELYYPPAGASAEERALAERTLRLVDRLGTPPLNAIRRELGLPERPHASTLGSLSDDAVLVIVSELFLSGTDSWPDHFRIAGYPAYEGSDGLAVPPRVQRFVDRTDLGPLVICTLGDSWANDYPPTCAHLARLAQRLRFRVLYLVCRGRVDAEGEHCLVHQFAPLSRLLPQARAIVHHAGRGSLLTGMRAGVPALMIPHWLDGFENARRAERLGVGRVVAPDLDPAAVSRAITELLGDEAYHVAARAAAARLAEDPDPGRVAEELVLGTVGSRSW
ncbi:hypothetical protein C6361_23970 [Plantactinospora sp. BC1]|nr:hypothetical protein C6361_23970 [Plantactinospora sp. BC1]